MKIENWKLKIIYSFIFFVLGAAITFFVGRFYISSCAGRYDYINPRFACLEKHVINKKSYKELSNKIEDYIDVQIKAEKAKKVSVFFRDLESGPTMGINSGDDFVPASLLKIPLVIRYFQFSEDNPDVLKELVQYNGHYTGVPEQIIKPKENLQIGEFYSTEELMRRTIIYSDNESSQLLYEHLSEFGDGDKLLLETYKGLGIIDPTDLNTDIISTRDYAGIFRMLYNSSFLNPKDSEEMLSILSESSFNDGLRTGVPMNLKIAHKFGERVVEGTDTVQLHDCGIVYYPKNPYEICVMTSGTNIDMLKSIISTISKMVYTEFESRKIK